MKSFPLFSVAILLLLLKTASSAQNMPLAPGAGTQAGTPTIQARSNLVVVDVVVTDRSQNPVHNLKAEDFQVREGGVAQTIKSFEEHSPANHVAPEAMVTLPPGVFTNDTPAPAGGPVNILLIDKLNTPLRDQPYLHNQIVKFLRTMRAGTPLAIFGLNTQLVYLQGFSSDPALLLAALESKGSGVRQSVLLNAPAGTNSESTSAALQTLLEHSGLPPAVIELIDANARQFEEQKGSDSTQQRTRQTLDAMNTLARYLAAVPGRKNLIWFSGSFPISIQPDVANDLRDPFGVVADMSAQFRETVSLLSRGQVAVYPIDAHGAETLPMQDASVAATGRYTEQKKPDNYRKDVDANNVQIAGDQSTMRQMAHDTGGQAFLNTNGLSAAVTKAIEQGSSYYTLTYTPSETRYDGRFRRIQVAVARGGELSYRRGYYAEPAERGIRQPSATVTASVVEHKALLQAMLRGAPGSTQILFNALVVPAGLDTDPGAAEGNALTTAAKGPFRRYTVNYSAAPGDIAFSPVSEDVSEAHLQFVVFVYNTDGLLLNRFSQTIQARLNAANLKKLQSRGVQFRQIVSVPMQGENFLRIAVYDLITDRVGALEIPVNAVKNLTIADPSKPSAPAPPIRPFANLPTD